MAQTNGIKELTKKREIFYSPNCKNICHICPLAKQRCLSFPTFNNIADNAFDLVHCDIWGPFKTLTHAGHSYFATVVDDKSRYTRVYLLENKNDILQVIHRFFKMIVLKSHLTRITSRRKDELKNT